jgi:hypothetical protein
MSPGYPAMMMTTPKKQHRLWHTDSAKAKNLKKNFFAATFVNRPDLKKKDS